MCDDGSDRLLIIDDNDTANCSGDVLEETAKSGNKSFSGANDLHKRRSPSTSSSSSSSSSSTTSSSSVSLPLNGQQQVDKGEKTEKQQPARKRKKEDVKVSTPSKNPPPNENAKVDEGANKKRKTERLPRSTANKHCQTDDLHQQPLKPDTTVLLDITIVFAPDPNTLYFTTKWRGRSYHGVITDGLSSKNQVFALKRERAERLNGGKSSTGVQNGQSPSIKARGKRALNRGIERKSRANPEEFSIFDTPDEQNDENKSAKLVKVQAGEAQKMFTQCPHKQCGHVFETVNEVNQHLIFRHVDSPAIIKESTACQYSPMATTSTGSDPIPELQQTTLCLKCRDPIDSKSTNEAKETKQQKTSRSASPSYSDISADDAPTLIKEENDESRQQAANIQQNLLLDAKLPMQIASGANQPQNSLTPRRPENNQTNKAASNSSTPAPSSSTPLSAKQPKRSAITPNMGMNQSQQSRPIHPTANFPMSFNQPNAQQQQQMINNHQLFNLMNMVNASGGLQIAPSTVPTVKAGGSITAGSSSFNLPQPQQQSINLPGSSVAPGGIGIVHPQQLGSLAANGMVSTNTPTSSSTAPTSDAMRHKIHELKTSEAANQQANLLGINNIALQQQQQRNASPNIRSPANNIPRGQQQLAFVRPPTSNAVNPQFPFFQQRMPTMMAPHNQQPFTNQQQMSLFAAMMGGALPGQMMPQQPK